MNGVSQGVFILLGLRVIEFVLSMGCILLRMLVHMCTYACAPIQ